MEVSQFGAVVNVVVGDVVDDGCIHGESCLIWLSWFLTSMKITAFPITMKEPVAEYRNTHAIAVPL